MPVPSDHWNSVYGARPTDELSWFQAEPTMSLELIRSLRPPPRSVIDVGAGASRLADRMVDDGVEQVTVLDISEHALAAVSERLGDHPAVAFVVADITTWNPPQTWDVWHDRAVFHFLTEPVDRAAYTSAVARAVASGRRRRDRMLRAGWTNQLLGAPHRAVQPRDARRSVRPRLRARTIGARGPSNAGWDHATVHVGRDAQTIAALSGSANPSGATGVIESAVGVPDPAWNPRESTLAMAAR